ncbi:zinc ribbon domain-containing protein [candidate division KSB1 bacterium]|nr:zinc ribbon domain-containing protein [candidate division KSB1 bacterium]
MPTYDYRCKECGHRYEVFQSITASPLTECPMCGGPVERLIGSGAGLVFKGSGFYITDYKNSKNGSETKKEAKTADKTTTPAKNDD